MRKTSFFTALLVLVMWTGFAAAQPRERGTRGEQGWGMHPSALGELNLTQEQKEKIRAQRDSYRKEAAPLRMELLRKRTELKLLWMETTLDPGKIKAKQKEILELRGQLQEKRTDHRIGFFGMLTPEQRTQLITRKLERKYHQRKDMRRPRTQMGGQSERR